MSNNAAETVIGGVVLAAAASFLVYAANTVGFSGPTDSYELSASFRSAEGIASGTDVRMAGVKIGSVSELMLNPENYRAEAKFTVRQGVQLPDDSSISISSEGLLGGNFVEIIPGGSEFYMEDGDEVLDTQGSISLISLLLKFVSGTSE